MDSCPFYIEFEYLSLMLNDSGRGNAQQITLYLRYYKCILLLNHLLTEILSLIYVLRFNYYGLNNTFIRLIDRRCRVELWFQYEKKLIISTQPI